MKQLEVAYDIYCEEHYYPRCVFLGRREYRRLDESDMAVVGMTADELQKWIFMTADELQKWIF